MSTFSYNIATGFSLALVSGSFLSPQAGKKKWD